MENLESQLEQFSAQFNAFLLQRFPELAEIPVDDDAVYVDQMSSNTIVVYNKFTDITLRLPRKQNGELKIVGLHFRKIEDCRRGHGTAVLNFIAENAERYGIKRVRIENANHRADALAEKLGFVLDEAVSDCKDYNDWVIDVAELRITPETMSPI